MMGVEWMARGFVEMTNSVEKIGEGKIGWVRRARAVAFLAIGGS